MGEAGVQPSPLGAARDWLWRHSSQPNGDPWDSDPDHLELAARGLAAELSQWLSDGAV